MQGVGELVDRLFPRGRVHDDFGQHWIELRGHHGAGFDPGIDPHAVALGQHHPRELAGGGLELAQWLFGVNPRFDGHAVGGGLGQADRLTGGHAHHPLDQIDAGHHFGYRMLDLQAGIDFEKVELIARRVVDEFDGTGRLIGDGFTEAFGGGQQCRAGSFGQVGRRGFFDHFLIAPLQAAITLAERHHLTPAIAKNLHFDMAGVIDKALQKDPAIAEKARTHAGHCLECFDQRVFVGAALQANPAATGGAFEHDGIADALSRGDGRGQIAQ